MIKMVLFDLDGTLLPMNQEDFKKMYFEGLGKKLSPHGYEAMDVVNAVMKGVVAMIKNDGSKKNEAAFWGKFCELLGDDVKKHVGLFDEYYRNEFQLMKNMWQPNPKSKQVIELVKSKGLELHLQPVRYFQK